MLPASNRLTSSSEFREVVRRGRRCGGPLMVVHLRAPSTERTHPTGPAGPRVGFVVSRAVGNAVGRNRVKRRLRHLARARTSWLAPGAMLVVRALPAAATASHAELAAELDRCLTRCGAQLTTTTGQDPVGVEVHG